MQQYPEWDIKLLSQRWGNTRFGYLNDHNEDDLINMIIPKLEGKPDVWVQITIPNEFQPMGHFNIGVTAGIETTIADYTWVEGCNRMDLNLVSSQHSKDVLTKYTYELKDDSKGSLIKLKSTSPVEVLFEGLDITKYFPTNVLHNTEMVKSLDSIEEGWCFLVVGHWLQGDFGQDRKNMGGTIKAFLEAFKDKPAPPALVIKTQAANASIMDRNAIMKKIEEVKSKVSAKKLPNIYLLHGEVTDEAMNELYNHPKIKAMSSLFRGEGFGRPLLEFAAVNKPIISSYWSAPLDFLDKEFTYFVSGKLDNVHKSAQVPKIILENSQWFTANESEAIKAYREVYSDYKKALVQAKRQGHKVRTNFTMDKMGEQLKINIDKVMSIDRYTNDASVFAPINLTHLTKI
jgi:glycosyltransferase involved in cell wall biosynthesis